MTSHSLRRVLFLSGAVAVFGAGLAVGAQQRPDDMIVFPIGRVVPSADIGFRVDGNDQRGSYGRLVIRADNQWIPVRLTGQ
jgi:hypothetical protein